MSAGYIDRGEAIQPWIAVLTTPTRTQYLRGTLAAIGAAGGDLVDASRIVFVDGDPDRSPVVSDLRWTKISVSGGGPPRGSRRAVWRVLHLAAIARVPYLIFFEDDVRPCRNAILAMSLIPVPRGLGFLTWCNQKTGLPATPPAPPAIYLRSASDPANAPGHWGNQALKLPARALHLFAQPSTEPRDEYAYSSDTWLGEKLGRYGIVVPSIIRHVGAETTIPAQAGMGIDGHRGGLNYAGDDFDALALVGALGRA
jgi:hypothetical protein